MTLSFWSQPPGRDTIDNKLRLHPSRSVLSAEPITALTFWVTPFTHTAGYDSQPSVSPASLNVPATFISQGGNKHRLWQCVIR